MKNFSIKDRIKFKKMLNKMSGRELFINHNIIQAKIATGLIPKNEVQENLERIKMLEEELISRN